MVDWSLFEIVPPSPCFPLDENISWLLWCSAWQWNLLRSHDGCSACIALWPWACFGPWEVTRCDAVECWNVLVQLGLVSVLQPSPWEEYSQAFLLFPEENEGHLQHSCSSRASPAVSQPTHKCVSSINAYYFMPLRSMVVMQHYLSIVNQYTDQRDTVSYWPRLYNCGNSFDFLCCQRLLKALIGKTLFSPYTPLPLPCLCMEYVREIS